MLVQLAVAALAYAGGAPAHRPDSIPGVAVRVDSGQRQVVVSVGPLHIPASATYAHHGSQANLGFAWPVSGWVRGYHLDIIDSAGRALPQTMLHHAGIANLDRRQLAYPIVERIVAVGRETAPVLLPASMGMPTSPGQRMVFYYALVNPTAVDVDGATLRVTIEWTPERSNGPRDVMPFFADANAAPGATRAFDLPPGVSVRSAEFTIPVSGHLRALGAHLHDYAVEIRLEDAVSGTVLARLRTERNADGTIRGVDRTRFLLKRQGLPLADNRQYRVVSVYDNPTCATIPLGAMAFLAGLFIPGDMTRWPAIDSADPVFQRDLASLLAGPASDEGRVHEHSPASTEPQYAAVSHGTAVPKLAGCTP